MPEVAECVRHLGYLDHVKAIHLNDSQYPLQSFRDRHANIGSGHIPLAGFRELLQTPEFRQVPIRLETPSSHSSSHREEIALIKQELLPAQEIE